MTLPTWAESPAVEKLEAQVAALQQTVSTLQTTASNQIAALQNQNRTLQNMVANQAAQIANLQKYVGPLQGVLSYNSSSSTVQFTGVNVQIVNGTGSTATTNSVGNLIIGYNEDDGAARGTCTDGVTTLETQCTPVGGTFTRSLGGSHNLVIGIDQGYSQYGGMVVGRSNLISGAFAVVSGGQGNTASGGDSSVSGGLLNLARGDHSSISGGGLIVESDVAGWAAGTGPTFHSP